MRPHIEEDIFGNDSLKLVLRYGTQVKPYFDKANNTYSFSQVLEVLRNKERKCYFLKVDDKQHKIIIPMSEEFGGQLEIVAEWDRSRNVYEIKVNKRKKTRYNALLSYIDQDFSIEQICELIFLSSDESYTDFSAIEETYHLYERVSNLEIAPTTQIENERELWTKFVKAQRLQIKKLSEPFDCRGVPTLTPIKNKDGNITRYKLIVPIEPTIAENEYEELISECKEAFNEDIHIDPHTGKSFMTEKQIQDVDTILQRKLQDKYGRVSEMTCILQIEQLNIKNVLIRELGLTQRKYYVDYDEEKDKLLIYANNANIPPVPVRIKEKYKLGITGIFCKYQKKDEYGNTFVSYEHNESVKALRRDADRMAMLAEQNRKQWIAEGDYVSVVYHVGCMYSYDYKATKFDDNFLNIIQREFYGLDYKFSKKNSTISFEFSSFDQLANKIEYLKRLNLFKIKYNPLQRKGFRFKVSYKSICEQDNINRREKLKNISFVAVLPNEKKKLLYIGTLNGYESNDEQLVFNMPYLYPEDKKIGKATISYLGKEDTMGFECVHADLRGDMTKIRWLEEAIDKLSEDCPSSTKQNAKPVNPRMRDFIFDSSKAWPTYKFEINDIKETEEYQNVRKRQLLMLNESQLSSVVKALYANDLCLLQGPPGTGKTTVIAELIWQHIMKDSLSHILVTSETNLAVDNALEKLMNGRNVPEHLSRYLTIVKPLRLGRSIKFEEEGKRFSVERIEKWLNDDYEEEFQYENEMSSVEDIEEEFLEEDITSDDYSHNAVQDWMNNMANRSENGDSQYGSILKEYVAELKNPSIGTKRYFKDKYFKYANVIGSTCCSTGSPAFAKDFAKVYSQQRFDNYLLEESYRYTIGDIRNLVNSATNNMDIFSDTARGIVDKIKKGNNIKKDEELIELLSDPSEEFKRFLFDYELSNLLRESNRPDSKKLNVLLDRLGFETLEDFRQFSSISFDAVIMDEASKATPPDLVLPLCFGKKAIVIGDHRQLPPMLSDKDFKSSLYELNDDRARKLADEIDREFTDISQFARLILNPQLSPTIKSVFTTQYRMHPQINDVISQFYHNDDGGLHCGLDEMRVDSPDLGDEQSRYHGFEHSGFISRDVHVIWVRVDGPELRAESGALYNDAEVVAVKRVLSYLKHSRGFDEYMSHWEKNVSDIQKRNIEQEVAIISFYSKQVSRLREAKAHAKKLNIRVKLNTVDKFQGMERNIVIVSTVRSRKRMKNGNIVDNYESGFAKSPERLNVALSRAKRLLIVVGDDEFFRGVKDRNGNFLYGNVINEIQKHSEVIDYKTLSKYD